MRRLAASESKKTARLAKRPLKLKCRLSRDVRQRKQSEGKWRLVRMPGMMPDTAVSFNVGAEHDETRKISYREHLRAGKAPCDA